MRAGTLSNDVHRVLIGNFPFTYHQWRPGERMPAGIIALDTETERIEGVEIPSLALVVASSGRKNVLVHPDDLPAFLLSHSRSEFVCHNAAFDFWVIHAHLNQMNEQAALASWVQVVSDRRMHDTMLLDMLLRLARGNNANSYGDSEKLPPRNLAVVVRDYTGFVISKEDPYRLRFGELIGANWQDVERGFFEYAIKDSICTFHTYREMRAQAIEVMESQGYSSKAQPTFEIYPDAPARFGLLSEAIQVEADIALSAISRNGLHTNLQRHHLAESAFRREFEPVVDELMSKYPGVIVQDRSGKPRLTAGGLPQKSHTHLDKQLSVAVEEIRQQTGTDVILPKTPKGRVSHKQDDWKDPLDRHAFVKLWSKFEKLAKTKQFLESLNRTVIHPRYNVLVRTGRTSCSEPNMQQVPRDDLFRQIIVPSLGHLLLCVDYSYIELVTLAAVCQTRFGYSLLGDVIRKGIDPHCYTAAMLANVSLEEFMLWKRSDNDRFKLARQQAKPVNFGVPGGMGPAALVDYAKNTFKVQMTLEQAENFHSRLTKIIYPELGCYLAGDAMAQLARRLNVAESICMDRFCFSDMEAAQAAATVRKIVRGQPIKKDGTPYSPKFVAKTWQHLVDINRNLTLSADLHGKIGSPQLAAKLFTNAAVTLTGRIRGDVAHTQQLNTPFQSLASDGAKRALGRLVLEGYRVVGFVHDEILIELPDQGGYVDRSVVESVVSIMCDSMQQMTGNVPVRCEYTLSDRWSKNAELIVDGDKVRVWRPDAESPVTP